MSKIIVAQNIEKRYICVPSVMEVKRLRSYNQIENKSEKAKKTFGVYRQKA